MQRPCYEADELEVWQQRSPVLSSYSDTAARKLSAVTPVINGMPVKSLAIQTLSITFPAFCQPPEGEDHERQENDHWLAADCDVYRLDRRMREPAQESGRINFNYVVIKRLIYPTCPTDEPVRSVENDGTPS
jgi:hypothetical protein